MSEEADNRTEAPTPKRREDAARRGDVAIAPEVRQAAFFGALLVAIGWAAARSVAALTHLSAQLWGTADRRIGDAASAQALARDVSGELAWALAALLILPVAAALFAARLQGPLLVRWSRIAPKWSKLLPWAGLSRLFGKAALLEFAKMLAKAAAIGALVLALWMPALAGIDRLVGASPAGLGAALAALAWALLVPLALLVGALALFDLGWQHFAWLRKLRMSKQDIRDEHKRDEGDPAIKGRIRAIQRQRAQRRMMAAVPGAAVVITNPTHYAVALRYDHGRMAAPVVVAKGVDAVALRIRAVAAEAGVPVLEAPPLARALYASVEIDQPIRVGHYEAVARIIGEVLRLAARDGG